MNSTSPGAEQDSSLAVRLKLLRLLLGGAWVGICIAGLGVGALSDHATILAGAAGAVAAWIVLKATKTI